MRKKVFDKRYELIRKLGFGGFADVHKAQDTESGLEVAIKVLKADLSENEGIVKRFLREAESMEQMDHPNVLRVFHHGFDSQRQRYYYVMELIEGILNPDKKICPRFSLRDKLEIILQATKGLHCIHQNGLIHRDIKPDNLLTFFLDPDEVRETKKQIITPRKNIRVKVSDLGIAKQILATTLTLSGTAMGTPYYMSPEQTAESKRVDHRTDVYSLGATLYHYITSFPPFGELSSLNQIIAKKINRENPRAPHEINPDIPPMLEKIIMKAMAVDKSERFQTMPEFRENLLEYFALLDYLEREVQERSTPTLYGEELLKKEEKVYIARPHKKVSWLKRIALGLSTIALLYFTATYTGFKERPKPTHRKAPRKGRQIQQRTKPNLESTLEGIGEWRNPYVTDAVEKKGVEIKEVITRGLYLPSQTIDVTGIGVIRALEDPTQVYFGCSIDDKKGEVEESDRVLKIIPGINRIFNVECSIKPDESFGRSENFKFSATYTNFKTRGKSKFWTLAKAEKISLEQAGKNPFDKEYREIYDSLTRFDKLLRVNKDTRVTTSSFSYSPLILSMNVPHPQPLVPGEYTLLIGVDVDKTGWGGKLVKRRDSTYGLLRLKFPDNIESRCKEFYLKPEKESYTFSCDFDLRDVDYGMGFEKIEAELVYDYEFSKTESVEIDKK